MAKLKVRPEQHDPLVVTFSHTTQGHALALAALERAVEAGGFEHLRFSEVCQRAGVPRSTAYKAFPAGDADVVSMYIRPWTIGSLTEAVEASILVESRSTYTFGDVLLAGTCGLLSALTQSPYTGRYLISHPLEAALFLLDDTDAGLVQAMTAEITQCTLGLGAQIEEPVARGFVTRVLRRALRELSATGAWPSGIPAWPDWTREFVNRLGAEGGIDLAARAEKRVPQSAEWDALRLLLTPED